MTSAITEETICPTSPSEIPPFSVDVWGRDRPVPSDLLVDLHAAILHTAVQDLRGDDGGVRDPAPLRRQMAIEWIAGDSGCDPALEFGTCCAVLGLDAEATSRALMQIPLVEGRRRRGAAQRATGT